MSQYLKSVKQTQDLANRYEKKKVISDRTNSKVRKTLKCRHSFKNLQGIPRYN